MVDAVRDQLNGALGVDPKLAITAGRPPGTMRAADNPRIERARPPLLDQDSQRPLTPVERNLEIETAGGTSGAGEDLVRDESTTGRVGGDLCTEPSDGSLANDRKRTRQGQHADECPNTRSDRMRHRTCRSQAPHLNVNASGVTVQISGRPLDR